MKGLCSGITGPSRRQRRSRSATGCRGARPTRVVAFTFHCFALKVSAE